MKEWIRNKSDEVAVSEGCYFDLAAAERVRTFFARFLRHTKGQFAGKPFEILPWEWDRVIAPLYGWRRPNGQRRFRRAGVAVPKKNGKSTLLAGISLYHLLADGESGAEVYSAAADKKQAGIIWQEAYEMAKRSKGLSAILRPVRSLKELHYDRNGSKFVALSSDVATKEGYNSSCTLFDELHAQTGWALWNALRFAGAGRESPLLFWITTAGFDRQSLCFDQWQYAKDVQNSVIVDTEFLPCVYETPHDAPWDAEDTWRAANPSYGVTIRPDEMRAACEEAKRSAVMENAFRRYRLNQWTASEVKWISSVDWSACKTAVDYAALEDRKCKVGLDLAATTDIAAAVLTWYKDGVLTIKPRFWVPYETIARRERENRVRIAQWAKRYITVTEGNVIDYNLIRKELNDLAGLYNIDEVCIDPWNATQIATDLQGDGFTVTYVRTGFLSISAASKEFEKLILSRNVQHDGNPVMDWQIGNVSVETDASGNIKPSKRRSPEKIDGPVAAILALARWIATPAKKASKYETERLLTV
jgi:phage terminase large subunit-like protein